MLSHQLISQRGGRAAGRSARRRGSASLLSAFFLLSLLAVGARASLSAPEAPALSKTAEEVRVVLRATGFEPAEIRRGASNFQLIVENRSGAQDLTLRLLRVEGGQEETVRDIAFPSGATEVREELALPAGDYRLVAVHRPAWLLRLALL